MSLIEALVLGLVQGLTEFVPVSSSGHLTLVPFIIGWDEPSLAFTVAVHLGTLVAVTWMYRERVRSIIVTALRWKDATEPDRAVLKLVTIATVPAAVIGAAFNGPIGRLFERPVIAAFLLGVTGYFLFATETVVSQREEAAREGEDMNTVDAGVIGLAQAAAILPGISRSGATIGAGMRRGLSREAAAHFSFLMSIPIIAGALLFEIPDMLDEGLAGNGAAFAVGIVTAGVSGFAAITWFIKVLTRRGLRPFGTYCLLMMTAGLVTALARG